MHFLMSGKHDSRESGGRFTSKVTSYESTTLPKTDEFEQQARSDVWGGNDVNLQ